MSGLSCLRKGRTLHGAREGGHLMFADDVALVDSAGRKLKQLMKEAQVVYKQ